MTRLAIATAVLLLVALLPVTPADAAKHHRIHPKYAPPPQNEIIVVTGIIDVAKPGSLKSAWVQYGQSGQIEARAVLEGRACPEIFIDLKSSMMQRRAAADSKFAVLCTASIPTSAKQAAIAFRHFQTSPPPEEAGLEAMSAWAEREIGLPIPHWNAPAAEVKVWRDAVERKIKFDVVPLPLPVSNPSRILVLGDTGCRIKGEAVQNCSDPVQWPFARIAAEAARLKPDLVIHVGDYLYRENACPANVKGCAGTPFGDNWPTWDADFFTPAKPLLAAAPWVIVRGNHEDCNRAGPGWLRLLGPQAYDPAAPCIDHLAPYTVPLGGLDLVVMDDADAPDTSVAEASVPVYRAELAGLANAKAPTWLVLHRPIWAAGDDILGVPGGGNLTLITADGTSGIAAPVDLMLAGHIHTFEALNYAPAPHVPPQIVAGFGGDRLDPTPSNLRGTIFQGNSGVRVTDGLSIGGFGFLLMTRSSDGWSIDVYDWQGRIERQCVFRAGRVDCPTRH
jgi:hypothetical protein